MFRLVKQIFMGLLTSKVSASNHTKWVLLSNQKRMTQELQSRITLLLICN